MADPRQRAIDALLAAADMGGDVQFDAVVPRLEAGGLRIVDASDFAAYEKLRRDITERRVALLDIGLPSEGRSAPRRNARPGAKSDRWSNEGVECPACKHVHAGRRLAGICVGCPCAEVR